MEMHFDVVRIVAFKNSFFPSLNLCYVKYLNVSYIFTVWGFCMVDCWILKFYYPQFRLHARYLL